MYTYAFFMFFNYFLFRVRYDEETKTKESGILAFCRGFYLQMRISPIDIFYNDNTLYIIKLKLPNRTFYEFRPKRQCKIQIYLYEKV